MLQRHSPGKLCSQTRCLCPEGDPPQHVGRLCWSENSPLWLTGGASGKQGSSLLTVGQRLAERETTQFMTTLSTRITTQMCSFVHHMILSPCQLQKAAAAPVSS